MSSVKIFENEINTSMTQQEIFEVLKGETESEIDPTREYENIIIKRGSVYVGSNRIEYKLRFDRLGKLSGVKRVETDILMQRGKID